MQYLWVFLNVPYIKFFLVEQICPFCSKIWVDANILCVRMDPARAVITYYEYFSRNTTRNFTEKVFLVMRNWGKRGSLPQYREGSPFFIK